MRDYGQALVKVQYGQGVVDSIRETQTSISAFAGQAEALQSKVLLIALAF